MDNNNRKDLLNLELELLNKQIKLMDQLSGLYVKQASYIDDENKKLKNNEAIHQKILELRRNGVVNIKNESDLDRERIKADKEMLKIYQEIEDLQDSINKKEEESLSLRIKRAKEYKKEQSDIEKLEKKAEERRKQIANQKKNLNAKDSTLNKRFNEDRKLNEILSEIANIKRGEANKEYMTDAIKQMKIGNSNIGKYVELNEKGISGGAVALQTAVDVFNKAVSIFSESVKAGFQRQTQSYESNFTNIAVRTGMSKSSYRNNQMQLGGFGTNILHEQGLMNNIKTSDVQNMWSTLADRGFSQEEILSSSLESVITSTIVPYLDVTTTEMQLFNQNVGNDGLLKQVRGISKLAQESYDNNIIATQYLQDQLNYLAPMSSVAEIDLMKSTATGQFMLQGLLDRGMSLDSIAELQRNTRIIQDDVYGALSSNNLSVQLGAINAVRDNVNTYTDYGGTLRSMLNGTTELASLTPDNSFQSSIVSSAWGLNGRSNYEISQLIKQGKLGNIDELWAKAQSTAGKLGEAGEQATNSLANDEFHTTKQLSDILNENLTNEVAAFAEYLGPIFEILKVIAGGIGAFVGAKVLGGVGKWALGKIAGNGASSLVGGEQLSLFGSSGGTAAAGGASASSSAIPLASAGGIATAATGIAGTLYGGYKTYQYGSQYAKSGKGADLGAAVTAGASTAAIAGGAITALTASGPVGWAIMAIGGIGLVAADLIEDLGHDGDIMEELNKASEERLQSFEKANYDWESSIEDVRESIESAGDSQEELEEQKRKLVEAGIATEKELQSEQYNNKSALIALTDQYLASTQELNRGAEEVAREMENKQNEEQNKISTSMWELSKKKLDDMSGDEKAAIGEFMKDYYYKVKELADQGDKDAKYRIDEWKKYGNNMTDGIVSQDDLNALNSLNTTHYGDNDDTYNLYKKIMSDDDFAHKATSSKEVKKYLGRDTAFTRIDSQLLGYVTRAIMSTDKESALSLLAQAKAGGLTYDYLKSIEGDQNYTGQLKEKWGIESYRVGTDSIPYDNYPAMLHEGEAVLTASTANELRGLIDEYRATKEDNIKIEQAIKDQTAVLVERLNAIYSKISEGVNPMESPEIMPGRLNQNMMQMTSAFRANV